MYSAEVIFNNNNNDGDYGGHVGFPAMCFHIAAVFGGHVGKSLPLFDLHATLLLPVAFGVNWLFGSGEELQIDFQNCGHDGHLGFSIGMILSNDVLQVTPILHFKFRVNWLFG